MPGSRAVMLILFAAAFGRLVYAISHMSALATAIPIMHSSTDVHTPVQQPEKPPTDEDLQFEMDLFDDTNAAAIRLEPLEPSEASEPLEPSENPSEPLEKPAESTEPAKPTRRLFCSCWRL